MNVPIVRASKTIPQWFRELPNPELNFGKTDEHEYTIKSKNFNIKHCYGFLELFKKGIVIENWADISIKSDYENFNYYYSSGPQPEIHTRNQIGNGFSEYHHIKLVSPWRFIEKTGVKFLWFGAEWSLDKLNIKILPGVINFDIISGINVNFMFPRIDNEFVVEIGQPLVHLIPISDKKLVFKNHLVDNNEFQKLTIDSGHISFYGWKKVLELRKRNKKRGTCPFGFGDNNE
jgi:hypothetical protein